MPHARRFLWFGLCLLASLSLNGCQGGSRSPMVWVLKEGVFTLTPGKPLVLNTVIESGKGEAEYEIIIEVKVASGDAVTVTTMNTKEFPSYEPIDQRPRLSTTTPVKEIKLTDNIREAAKSRHFSITVNTAGNTSDVSVKVTKLLK